RCDHFAALHKPWEVHAQFHELGVHHANATECEQAEFHSEVRAMEIHPKRVIPMPTNVAITGIGKRCRSGRRQAESAQQSGIVTNATSQPPPAQVASRESRGTISTLRA